MIFNHHITVLILVIETLLMKQNYRNWVDFKLNEFEIIIGSFDQYENTQNLNTLKAQLIYNETLLL